MKVLNLNPAFCMRAYRQLKALSDRGFEVHLRYLGYGRSLTDLDDGFIASKEPIFGSSNRLSHFSRTLRPSAYRKIVRNYLKKDDYDVIIVHNMPDILGMAAIRYGDLPVIFDERDMVSSFQRRMILSNYIPPKFLGNGIVFGLGMRTVYRRLMGIERFCLQRSSGRTWVSDYTHELAKRKYDLPAKNDLMLYNYAGEEDIRPEKDKLSEKDGEPHIVYEGVLSLDGYRAPLLDVFNRISGSKVHIHIYGIGAPEVLEKYMLSSEKDPYFHLHDPLPHPSLMEEMTAYDWGIVPFDPPAVERDHFDTMLPNKFFDYLAAGLPVLSPSSRSMIDFITKNKVGAIYPDVGSIPEILQGKRPAFDRGSFTIEGHIDGLIDMIRDVTQKNPIG